MQILLAQAANAIGPYAGPAVAQFSNPTVNGNEIRVSVTCQSVQAPSVSDNKGNIYEAIGPPILQSNQTFQQDFYCAAIVGGAGHQVTVAGYQAVIVARELVTTGVPNDLPLLQQIADSLAKLVNAARA